MKINRVIYCLIATLPLLALASASLVRLRDDFSLTLFVPCLAAVLVIILIRKNVPKYAYPLAVFSIALSLIMHSEATLGSNYLYGGDIQTEYLWLNRAIEKGWQPAMGSNLVTALSITVVWAELSQLLHADPIWLYKILTSLLLPLIPLMLYFIYKYQIGGKRAFLATVLFTSVMLTIPYGGFRVVLGEFLLALCLLLLLATKVRLSIRITALIISSMCLVLAYYAIGILYSYMLAAVCLLMLLLRRYNGKQLLLPLKYIVTLTVITVITATLWYTFSGGGVVVYTINTIGQEQMSQGFWGQLFHFKEQAIAVAFGLDFGVVSMQGKAFRVIQLLIELFIIVGLLKAIIRLKAGKWSNEFIAFGMAISFALLLCVVLPSFSGYWGAEKFYQVSLFIMAPFCIIGGETIFKFLPKLRSKAVLLTAVIIVAYFLFHNGVIFEITKSSNLNRYDTPSRMILSSYRIDNPNWKKGEYEALQWFLDNIDEDYPIYGDAYALPLFSHFEVNCEARGVLKPYTVVPKGAFIFLREYNTKTGKLAYLDRGEGERTSYWHRSIPYSDDWWETIYSDGKTIIYRTKR